jgi:hypothetical protein
MKQTNNPNVHTHTHNNTTTTTTTTTTPIIASHSQQNFDKKNSA